MQAITLRQAYRTIVTNAQDCTGGVFTKAQRHDVLVALAAALRTVAITEQQAINIAEGYEPNSNPVWQPLIVAVCQVGWYY